MDIVNAATRSRMMSGIRGKNTKPEVRVRQLLHGHGFRFRLHVAHLPGKPDIVLPRFRAVVMVHGCFWHGHECHLFKWPGSRVEFWKGKIERNRMNDLKAVEALLEKGWRVATIWECAIKGVGRMNDDALAQNLTEWIQGNAAEIQIIGNNTKAL